MTIDKTSLKEKLNQVDGDYSLESPLIDDILSHAIAINLVSNATIRVADVSSLPDLNLHEVPNGMIYFIDAFSIFAVNSQKKWLTLDGVLLRDDNV